MMHPCQHEHRIKSAARSIEETGTLAVTPPNRGARTRQVNNHRQNIKTFGASPAPCLADNYRVTINRYNARATLCSDQAELARVAANVQHSLRPELRQYGFHKTLLCSKLRLSIV